MKAIIITAVIVVMILAIGIPVIHYATKSDDSTISAKTLATGSAVATAPAEETPSPQTAPAQQAAAEPSAKEMLEQYKQNPDTATPASKTGYTIAYLLNQSRAQQAATCEPLLDAAQDKLADAESAVKSKLNTYDDARDRLNELMDNSADQDEIDDAREDMEKAKKAYEDALAVKYKANDALVKARIQCASYLTK